MKALKFTFSIVIFTLLSSISFGQKGYEDGSRYGHGEDSIRCVRNYSLYREYYKQKNYKDALPYWRIVMKDCPKVTKSIYQNGVAMYKFYIIQAQNNNNNELKNALVDTLLQVYDQRIKWYPKDKANVLGYKANDILRFKSNDITCVKKAYEFSGQSIDVSKTKASKSVIQTYMTTTLTLFENKEIGETEVVQNYAKTMDILDAQLEKSPEDEDLYILKGTIQSYFANSGAASCESLIQLFTPQFEANAGDIDELKKILYMLNSTGCTESDLYLEATMALNKIEPSGNLAYHIAKLYNSRGQYSDAIEYYEQAIAAETDMPAKSKYLVELGYIIHSEKNNLSLAKKYALESMSADPTSGQPNILLGNIYASVKNFGEDDLAHLSVYWVAVDQYKQAIRKDSELAQVANAKIKTYSQYFPDTEMVFFYGYKVGDTYKLGGWINESTKVRTR
ncbi:MAG: hypothetical protein QNK30_07920 [Bacteroidales bacterium]|nr:hypothetical protein [Bacteroidales bacterium]